MAVVCDSLRALRNGPTGPIRSAIGWLRPRTADCSFGSPVTAVCTSDPRPACESLTWNFSSDIGPRSSPVWITSRRYHGGADRAETINRSQRYFR
jgi:hypothetical protein